MINVMLDLEHPLPESSCLNNLNKCQQILKKQTNSVFMNLLCLLDLDFKSIYAVSPIKGPVLKEELSQILKNVKDYLLNEKFHLLFELLQNIIDYGNEKQIFVFLSEPIASRYQSFLKAFHKFYGSKHEFSLPLHSALLAAYFLVFSRIIDILNGQNLFAPTLLDLARIRRAVLLWESPTYIPTSIEINLATENKCELIAWYGKDNIPWIQKLQDFDENHLTLNFKKSLLMKMCHRGLKNPSPIIDFQDPQKHDFPEVIRYHFENEVYRTQFNMVFGSKFLTIVDNEYREICSELKNMPDCKSKRERIDVFSAMQQVLIHFSGLMTIGEIIEDKVYSLEQCCTCTNIKIQKCPKNGMKINLNCCNEEFSSRLSCARNRKVCQATIDRLPWDIPLLMSWQEDLYTSLMKMEFALTPLFIYPVSIHIRASVENFAHLLMEGKFILQSSMLIADYLALKEGDSNYDWTSTINLRKTLHEHCYRLRHLMTFLDVEGQANAYSLVSEFWKPSLRTVKIPTSRQGGDLDIESLFLQSPRHLRSWLKCENHIENPDEVFLPIFAQIEKVEINGKTLKNQTYHKTKEADGWELSDVEKMLISQSGFKVEDITIKDICNFMVVQKHFKEPEMKYFLKQVDRNEVTQDIVSFLIGHFIIYSTNDTIEHKTPLSDREMYFMSSYEVFAIRSLCKVDLAIQFVIGSRFQTVLLPPISKDTKDHIFKTIRNVKLVSFVYVFTNIQELRTKLWVEDPITKIPTSSLPILMEIAVLKSKHFAQSPPRHWLALMEMHRTQLIRTVVDKYFNTAPGTKNACQFPYWNTLVSFLEYEINSILELNGTLTKDEMRRLLHLINYRVIWMQKLVKSWLENPKPAERTNWNLDLALGNLWRNQSRGALLVDEINPKFGKDWAMAFRMFNFQLNLRKCLLVFYPTYPRSSAFMSKFMRECLMDNLEEVMDYLDVFQLHSSHCLPESELKFYSDFEPGSKEHSLSILFTIMRLLSFFWKDMNNNPDSDFMMMRTKILILRELLLRNARKDANAMTKLHKESQFCWASFREDFLNKSSSYILLVPERLYEDSGTDWIKILRLFKAFQFQEIENTLKIIKLNKRDEVNVMDLTKQFNYLTSFGSHKSSISNAKDAEPLKKSAPEKKVTTKEDKTKELSKLNAPVQQPSVTKKKTKSVSEIGVQKDSKASTENTEETLNTVRVIKSCAACKKKETKEVRFKKCKRCRDENLPEHRFYCGHPCQLKDWTERHEKEHRKWTQSTAKK